MRRVGDRWRERIRRGWQEAWALRDVSFDVLAGERVGVIGRNGAGKSTLLKMLSRISEPTEGRAEIRGRVASMLEVGTGFHNELTGRENIWLAGTVLGMRRSEVRRHFDEIVEFADIGSYLDTPVKHYSSGMYVRLAFAVAAHLLSDLLLVDEVLAVGDIDFQKRCLQRMGTLSQEEGRTVLFVSHNLASVRTLCSKVLWLKGGRVEMFGPADQVLETYARSACVLPSGADLTHVSRTGSGEIRFTRAGVVGPAGGYVPIAEWGERCVIRAEFSVEHPLRDLLFACGIDNVFGSRVVTADSRWVAGRCVDCPTDGGCVEFVFDPLYLMPGEYVIMLSAYAPDGRYVDRIFDAFRFEVHRPTPAGAGGAPRRDCGDCLLPHDVRVLAPVAVE